jgi:WD40 repeat protein
METKLQKINKFYFGSYEGKIYAVDVDLKTKQIISSYAFKVSENSLKVLVVKDGHLFASGIDEIVHIFDMKKKEDKGSVMTYSGSVMNLQIVKNFLFASGDEPTISIWRMTDFSMVHTLKGHKAAVNNFIIHKSAKFGISTARDSTLIIWNLITGTKIVRYNFKDNLICNKILFLKEQTLAILIFENEFWLFDLFKNSENYEEWVIKKLKVGSKIVEAFTFKTGLFLIHTNGEVTVFSDIVNNDASISLHLNKPERISEDDLDIRVKTINLSKNQKLNLLNVVYSNNEIYIYDLNKLNKSVSNMKKEHFKEFMKVDIKTKDRITCLNSVLI